MNVIASLIPSLLVYVYYSYSLMTLSKKLNAGVDVLCWIPIVNFFAMLTIAQKPWWYFILLFIPIANLFAIWDIWASIGERRGKGRVWGCIIFVPLLNIIVPGYLAFVD